MINKKIVWINVITLFLASIILGQFGVGGLGLTALLVGVADLLTGLVFLIPRNKGTGLTLLLCAGVLLVVGFSICSLVPSPI